MSKNKSSFVCQQCNYSSPRWFGKCPECGEWNTAVETVTNTGTRQKALGNSNKSENKKSNAYSLMPNASVLYVSGEESPVQIKIRADRLGIKGEGIQLLETTDIDEVVGVSSEML